MKFFQFESFISTTLIKIAFVLGLLLALFGYLGSVGIAFVQKGATQAIGVLVGGGIMLALALVLWRVYCELAIVLFRIYEELQEVGAKLDGGVGTGRGERRQRPSQGEPSG